MSAYPFHYHRAYTLAEAVTLLSQLGEEARPLAGGQSLLPLMKLRLARPSALVDLSFVPGLSSIQSQNSTLRFGAMVRHSAIEDSVTATRVPILHDCAAGIADPQVRNMGTIGGSVAEADPSGDWIPVLLTQGAEVNCMGPNGERSIGIAEFVKDAYTTALAPAELVREIVVKVPPAGSGGAYVAFKRCAPVYASASVAAQLTLDDAKTCKEIHIALGCVGLTAVVPKEAEAALRGKAITPKTVEAAADAAMAAADPQTDARGTAEYKRILVRALVKRAINLAARRAAGEQVEATHEYVGRA